eukprot:m.517779 g.517779  ORF g.517779 m.517779 type:complete len:289 (+) comp21936_c0_seq2:887-1753(+)
MTPDRVHTLSGVAFFTFILVFAGRYGLQELEADTPAVDVRESAVVPTPAAPPPVTWPALLKRAKEMQLMYREQDTSRLAKISEVRQLAADTGPDADSINKLNAVLDGMEPRSDQGMDQVYIDELIVLDKRLRDAKHQRRLLEEHLAHLNRVHTEHTARFVTQKWDARKIISQRVWGLEREVESLRVKERRAQGDLRVTRRLLHERRGALPESGNTSGGSRAVSVTSLADVGESVASVQSSERDLLLQRHRQGSLKRSSTPPTGMASAPASIRGNSTPRETPEPSPEML